MKGVREMGRVKLKEGEVYIIDIADKEKWSSWAKDSYWVVRDCNGELELVNTFHGLEYRYSTSYTLTLKEATELGKLQFYFSLNDVKEIPENEQYYYAGEDVFFLGENHGYRPHWYLRKGAEKNQARLIETLEDRIDRQKDSIGYDLTKLADMSEKLGQVRQGNLDIYL